MVKERYDKLKVKFVDPVLPLTKIAKTKIDASPNQHFISGGLLYRQSPVHGAILCVPDVYDESGTNHRKRIFDECHSVDYRGLRSDPISHPTTTSHHNRFFGQHTIILMPRFNTI